MVLLILFENACDGVDVDMASVSITVHGSVGDRQGASRCG
jgi:hypothetical protein